MTKVSELLVVTDEQRKAILDYYNLPEKDFEDMVRTVKEWAEKNPHLPIDHISDSKIKVCLMCAKMSVEQAKQMIEGYFRIRAIHSDFFDRLLPNTNDFDQARRYVLSVAMPKLTTDLCRITLTRFNDPEGEADDALIYYITTLMICEMRIDHDSFLSNIIVADLADFSFKTILKFTPTVQHTLSSIINAVKFRVQDVHLINTPPLFESIMGLCKSVVPSKIMSKIKVHHDLDSLHQCVPKDCLPSDYGGTQKSFEELYDDWCEALQKSEPVFRDLLGAKSKEDLRYVRDDKAIFGMGTEGSFRKIAID